MTTSASKSFLHTDWFKLAIEFVVLVIGILLAFQLNEWSESRKEQKLVALHLTNLQEETGFNMMMLQGAITTLENDIELASSFLAQQEAQQSAEELNEMVINLLNISAVYIKKNAYLGLIDSGDVRFMTDFAIKNNVITLYEYYNWLSGLDQVDLQFKLDYFHPFAMAELDVAEGTAQPLEVYKSKQLRNIVGGLRFNMQARLEKYRECLRQANALSQVLKNVQKESD